MPGPYRRVPQELKDKILDAVKNDGIPVSQASREYGVSTPSIHAWLKKELENTPFVHKLLRKWRNINHHNERLDFKLYEIRAVRIKEEIYNISPGYNIFPIILFNEKLKNIMDERFSSEKILTDATVSSLVANHNVYMTRMFNEFEAELQLPKKFVQYSTIQNDYRTFGSGSFDRFVSAEDFWKEDIK